MTLVSNSSNGHQDIDKGIKGVHGHTCGSGVTMQQGPTHHLVHRPPALSRRQTFKDFNEIVAIPATE